MNPHKGFDFPAATIAVWFTGVAMALGAILSYFVGIPSCPEDAALVGTGYFQWGRWTSYVCGPAIDDMGD